MFIVLSQVEQGGKPFRVYSSFIQDPEFLELARKSMELAYLDLKKKNAQKLLFSNSWISGTHEIEETNDTFCGSGASSEEKQKEKGFKWTNEWSWIVLSFIKTFRPLDLEKREIIE